MLTGLLAVTCLTAVIHHVTDAMEGSRTHSFQDDVVRRLGQGAAGPGTPPSPKEPGEQGKPKSTKGKFGRYTPVVYKKKDKDCQVTYTCQYGLGFDEVRAATET
jgi:hypothetical protein